MQVYKSRNSNSFVIEIDSPNILRNAYIVHDGNLRPFDSTYFIPRIGQLSLLYISNLDTFSKWDWYIESNFLELLVLTSVAEQQIRNLIYGHI